MHLCFSYFILQTLLHVYKTLKPVLNDLKTTSNFRAKILCCQLLSPLHIDCLTYIQLSIRNCGQTRGESNVFWLCKLLEFFLFLAVQQFPRFQCVHSLEKAFNFIINELPRRRGGLETHCTLSTSNGVCSSSRQMGEITHLKARSALHRVCR